MPKLNQLIKSDLNNLRKEMNADFKEHIGVLHEKFSEEVKLLAEAHQDTDKHIGRLEQRISRLDLKIDMLIDTTADMKVEIAGVNERLDGKVDLKDHKKLEQKIAALLAR